ncbi:MAG TPA: hemin uptake protein HemP [Candidatus Binatia bacterium]|jgi:hemin uptake protein HemP
MRETIVNFATQRAPRPNRSVPLGQKPRIESNNIFQGKSEVIIVHQNEEYNLRITRNGKLILTK